MDRFDRIGEALKSPPARWAKFIAVLLAALLLVVMPQLKYAALHFSFYDLGQYATIIHAVAFGGEGGQAFHGHAHPLIPVYALVYWLFPSPATLLALQSCAVVASGLFAGLVWRRSGAGTALDGALIYFLSVSVWFAALFEFHFEHLLFPIFFGAVLATLGDGWRARICTVALGFALCLVKETYALMAIGFGLYLIVGKRWYGPGVALILLSAAYFLAVTETVIPYYSRGLASAEIWGSAFGHLGSTAGEIVWTILTSPLSAISEALQPRKLLYACALGGAFAFLWLRAPLILLAAVPVLALSMLSRNPSHYYLGTQYTVGVTAVLFAATAFAVARFAERRRPLLAGLVMACSLLVLVAAGPSPLSRLFLQDATWSYGSSAYSISERDRWVRETIDRIIPSDPTVPVATQNTMVTARLAARRALMAFPAGVSEPFKAQSTIERSVPVAFVQAFRPGAAATENLAAEWVTLDLKRELYLGDQGCGWRSGVCTDETAEARFMAMRARLDERYERVFAEDGLEIFRRR